jgi:ubiquinone/menaquinone biosynthesis C-methylase UbiE
MGQSFPVFLRGIMHVLRRFISSQTPKVHFLLKAVDDRPFRLLDVGAGNHSPSKTKRLFPACEYHGLDLNKDYSYDDEDERALAGFYEMDLTQLRFESIPDNYFDYITMAHIIEHLHNGDEVIRGLTEKLKPGGYIYIEFPGIRSTKLPSMEGSLNFHDDKTHVRVYSHTEVGGVLRSKGFTVIQSGTRRSWAYVFATPFRAAAALLRGRKVQGNVLWDLMGFAEFVFARKNG